MRRTSAIVSGLVQNGDAFEPVSWARRAAYSIMSLVIFLPAAALVMMSPTRSPSDAFENHSFCGESEAKPADAAGRGTPQRCANASAMLCAPSYQIGERSFITSGEASYR